MSASAEPTAGRMPVRWAAGVMGAAAVATAVLFVLTAANAGGQATLWENGHWSVVAGAAAILGYLGYRRAPAAERVPRGAIAVGTGLYCLGQVAWNLQTALGLVSVPALSDLFFLPSAIPIAYAFVHGLSRVLTPTERVAFTIDAAIVVATLTLLLWVVFGQTALVSADPTAGALLLLYPLCFLGASAISALAGLRRHIGADWTGINALLLGLALTGFAWVLWLSQAVVAIPPPGSAVNYAFSIGTLAVGIGAYRLRLRKPATRTLVRFAGALEVLFPMAAVAAAVLTIMIAEAYGPEAMDTPTQAGGFVIVALALIRQSLLMLERQRLGLRDRAAREAEAAARAAAEAALEAQRASEERYRQAVEVFGRLSEQLSFGADEASLVRAGAAALRRLIASDAGDLLLANASQDRLVVGTAWGPSAQAVGEAVDDLRPVACFGIRRGSVYAVPDAGDDLMLPCPAHEITTGSMLCVPMLALGQTVGVVHLEAAEPNAFTLDDERQASRVAEQVALAIVNARLVRTMESMALTDPLTRLHNSRFFDPFLDRELAAARRADEPMGVIMIDLDHFKAFNDEHGHAAGDEALRAFARAALTVLRDSDTLARYGGEEFVVAVRGGDMDGTAAVAERLRAAVEGMSIEVGPGHFATVTASFGVASTTALEHDRIALLRAADRALYRAKRQGRNRVVVAGPPRLVARAAASA